MRLQLFSEMATVVEALLTNQAAIASRCLVLLIGMFSDVMLLEVVSSVKATKKPRQIYDERSVGAS